ncbi:MAG: LacI family DNA-binding transcriptional regulator [Candidatus Planktophila sp.]
MAKTLKDVASAAGVSSATASLVLNGRADGRVSLELAAKVEQAAEKLDYRPNLVARSLRTQVSKTLGLISNDVATSPFAGAMLAGAKEVAWEQGWLLFLVNTNDDKEMEAAATHSLIQRNIDGLIYAAMYHQEIEAPEYFKDQKFVLLDCIDSKGQFDSVVPQEYEGALSAMEYLIEQGHIKIAHLTTGEKTIAGQERLRAYKDVLTKNKVKIDNSFIIEAKSSNSIDGYHATQKLLQSKNLPTAIFCYTDRMAMGAYEAIAEAGLSIPKDISVVGFDNQLNIADALRPGLTTVQLPHYEMGAWAVNRLLATIESENSEPREPEHMRIACPLVVRSSVAPPRK